MLPVTLGLRLVRGEALLLPLRLGEAVEEFDTRGVRDTGGLLLELGLAVSVRVPRTEALEEADTVTDRLTVTERLLLGDTLLERVTDTLPELDALPEIDWVRRDEPLTDAVTADERLALMDRLPLGVTLLERVTDMLPEEERVALADRLSLRERSEDTLKDADLLPLGEPESEGLTDEDPVKEPVALTERVSLPEPVSVRVGTIETLALLVAEPDSVIVVELLGVMLRVAVLLAVDARLAASARVTVLVGELVDEARADRVLEPLLPELRVDDVEDVPLALAAALRVADGERLLLAVDDADRVTWEETVGPSVAAELGEVVCCAEAVANGLTLRAAEMLAAPERVALALRLALLLPVTVAVNAEDAVRRGELVTLAVSLAEPETLAVRAELRVAELLPETVAVAFDVRLARGEPLPLLLVDRLTVPLPVAVETAVREAL